MAQEDYNKISRDSGELVLAPGVFAFVLDKTKGNINTYCGPIKQSLSNTDQLVTFNGKRFVDALNQSDAIQTNVIVPKGSYVVLENPSNNGKQPEPGKAEVMPIGTLRMGQIENLSGPQSFPLWPGQIATVVKGHHLRSNQYLMVRVYDDEAARLNWDKSVVKSVSTETTDEVKPNNVLGINKNNLVTGQLIVIKGTAVSFYIPPTGIEVLKDEDSNYVRDAVTLERLEYSILLDESGNKEYKIGPDVVFPTPTQKFYVKDGNRKFRAFELQPTSGLHIKVIADYTDKVTKQEHKAGDELFITGSDMPIYYPREEHAIISYGNKEKIFAVAIPSGEGRYVLDRLTGNIDLVKGPAMFLPNPITQVVVQRILSDTECELYYPGNAEVLRINRERRQFTDQSTPESTNLDAFLSETSLRTRSFAPMVYGAGSDKVGSGVVADAMNRGTKYTPPRTITLNTKYDGAIRIDAWSGFAVQVVNSKGDRHTVLGPQTVLLQYDEYLERLSLSKGKPKNSDNCMNTAFLRHISNPVSDIISLKTQDLVNVQIQVKYLVRFEEADKDHWFGVDNYVQYMVDHLRSMIGNHVRNIGVQDFYSNAATILRDVVLGAKVADADRKLKHFEENGMTVYDLELISIVVEDKDVANLLSTSRQQTLSDSVELERAKEHLTLVKGKQDADRQLFQELANTEELKSNLAAEKQQREIESEEVAADAEIRLNVTRKKGELGVADIVKSTKALYLQSEKAASDLKEIYLESALAREVTLEVERAAAQKTRMEAVNPTLTEALVALAQEGMFEKIAEHLAPLSIVRGESLAGTFEQLFKGTPLEGMINNVVGLSKVKTTSVK
jgi:major vault protein